MTRHVIRSQDFDRGFLEALFSRADEFRALMNEREETKRRQNRLELKKRLYGYMLFNVFYEPSTRTRMSFAAAAQHLGMDVVGTENARDFSSAAKGESIPDTFRVDSGYHPDIMVLRHYETGAAELAAKFSSIPVINAGDGRGQHPTQGFLDIYTIEEAFDRVDGLTVVIGGDLANGRTARSLACNLSRFDGVRIIFVTLPQLAIGGDIKAHLVENGVKFEETESLAYALGEADVVYWTRIQKERLPAEVVYEKVAGSYILNKESLSKLKPNAIIMHPLPRVNEIAAEVDDDPRAAYFRQAENGLYIRMALLEWVLEKW